MSEPPTPTQVLDFIAWMQNDPHVEMDSEELFRHFQHVAPSFGLSMDDEGLLTVLPCQ
jgi:hypothetical protein